MTSDFSHLMRFEGAQTVLLPSRAYLLSAREMAIPMRRAALDDAMGQFADLQDAENLNERDMALLGVIGEMMQILEDVAYFASAYESPMQGMPYYVGATLYSAFTPNTFYESFKNWSDDRILVLACLRVRDPADGTLLTPTEVLEMQEQMTPEILEAVGDAEGSTVFMLRASLAQLAASWSEFLRYHHAFKHGGLFINRDDFELLDDSGESQVASLMAWRRKTGDAQGMGDTNLTAEEVADQVVRTGRLALQVHEYLVDARLRLMKMPAPDGEDVAVWGPTAPWEFWVVESRIKPESLKVLEEAFGLVFLNDGGPEKEA